MLTVFFSKLGLVSFKVRGTHDGTYKNWAAPDIPDVYKYQLLEKLRSLCPARKIRETASDIPQQLILSILGNQHDSSLVALPEIDSSTLLVTETKEETEISDIFLEEGNSSNWQAEIQQLISDPSLVPAYQSLQKENQELKLILEGYKLGTTKSSKEKGEELEKYILEQLQTTYNGQDDISKITHVGTKADINPKWLEKLEKDVVGEGAEWGILVATYGKVVGAGETKEQKMFWGVGEGYWSYQHFRQEYGEDSGRSQKNSSWRNGDGVKSNNGFKKVRSKLFNFPKPLKVNCFQCQKSFEIKFVIARQQYSQKNNWDYWTEENKHQNQKICNNCLRSTYQDKLTY
ncbi:2408_t:CDS:2 [Gigaspora margarita]|uniref:2408_t:CDS:1 n=1 Tax=Gigaspora margarita TaxID=4874 RepID=A0ABN7UW45_GIGMA|nr:2408_t:CDS:2 [Gigaspora margarita]